MAKQLNSFEKNLFAEELEQKGYKELVLKLEKTTVQPDEFVGIFPKSQILKDKEYVAQRERAFSAAEIYQEKKAKILEAIIVLQAELNNWFGESTFTVKTSRLDDIANGVDMIIEFADELDMPPLVLAVDITLSENVDVLTRKLTAIRKDVENGTLSNIKYFVSETKDFKGSLWNLPKVVLNTNQNTLSELTELALNKDKALANHPVQITFLEEMELQLKSFLAISTAKNKEKIAQLIKSVSKILESKRSRLGRNILQENSYLVLRAVVKNIFPESE